MLPALTIPVPTVPPAPAGWAHGWHRRAEECVNVLQRGVSDRVEWWQTLLRTTVTDEASGNRWRILCRPLTLGGTSCFPWRFAASADGTQWWPCPSQALAATPSAGGLPGKLLQPTDVLIAGAPMDTWGPSNPLPLADSARTFYVRARLETDPDVVYAPLDSLPVAIPTSLDILDTTLGDPPGDSDAVVHVPWLDLPALVEGQPRVPTYHFSLWFRLCHYGPRGGSSSSSSSLSSSVSGSRSKSPSSSSSHSKPIVL